MLEYVLILHHMNVPEENITHHAQEVPVHRTWRVLVPVVEHLLVGESLSELPIEGHTLGVK